MNFYGAKKLTRSNLLLSNTVFSLIGHILPALVGLYSIPILITNLGNEAFGILTIVWMIVGYFGFFDLGVGRALTKMLSNKIGQDAIDETPQLVWTGLLLSILMGCFAAFIMSLLSTEFLHDLLNLSPDIKSEMKQSLNLIVFLIPIITSVGVLREVLASFQRFDLINYLRIPVGSLTFLAPVLMLNFSTDMTDIILSLVVLRVIEWIANFILCISVVPGILTNILFDRSKIFSFLKFGGWLSISNLIDPVMLYMDRLMIASIISVSAVAYYAVPFEIISRLLIIPGAISGVLFPAFGTLLVSDPERAKKIFCNGVRYTFIIMVPIVFILFNFTSEGLRLWVGDDFSDQGSILMQILLIALLLKSLTYFPYSLLHAAGRPDLTAKVHIIEAPIYGLTVWVFITHLGIAGAAITVLLRSAIDNIILFMLAKSVVSVQYSVVRCLKIGLFVVLFFLCASLILDYFLLKISYVIAVLIILLIYFWIYVLSSEERRNIYNMLNKTK